MEIGYIQDRYSRQLPLIGLEGQLKLLKSTALVVGAGGLGSPTLLYLVAAGVGRVIVVDKGYVDLPDLNRQVLYTERDIGKPKALVAQERLRKLSSSTTIIGYVMDVHDADFEKLVAEADVVIDCLDNWPARAVLNELVVKYSKVLVHAGVHSYYGQVTTVIPGQTPCLNCIVTRPAERTEQIPVIGYTPAVLGAIEVAEAIRVLLGERPALAGELLIVDLRNIEFSKVKISRRIDCPVCSYRG